MGSQPDAGPTGPRATSGVVSRRSPLPVAETVDRLATAIRAAGAKLLAEPCCHAASRMTLPRFATAARFMRLRPAIPYFDLRRAHNCRAMPTKCSVGDGVGVGLTEHTNRTAMMAALWPAAQSSSRLRSRFPGSPEPSYSPRELRALKQDMSGD